MFHENLRQLRVKKGLSQKQVADYLNISPQSISKWEKGDALPSIEFLPGLAEILSCEINDFFAKEDATGIDASLLKDFLALEAKILCETESVEAGIKFLIKYPDAYDMVWWFFHKIAEYTMMTRESVCGFLHCSKEEAKDLLDILESMELVEKQKGEDCWLIIKNNVEGHYGILKIKKALLDVTIKNSPKE